jgi:hypothetical protein
MLRLGPDDPTAERDAAIHVTFWSADWTPWRALAALAEIFCTDNCGYFVNTTFNLG